MNFYIIIPAHNEEAFIGQTLQSLTKQTLKPKRLVVVNDNSTDKTPIIAQEYASKYPWLSVVNSKALSTHMPGAKIVNAFYQGYQTIDNQYDVICKFDADLIFPENYLETLAQHFGANSKLGMASGFCYIEKNSNWVLENLTNTDHIRGALKAYRKECFNTIGGLKSSMGWDTVDELLAKYHGWEIYTNPQLKVKHLKPTGTNYNKASKYLQGEALYKMRYGFGLTLITALKLALRKKQGIIFIHYIQGFFKALKNKSPFIVSENEGAFIRKLRWRGVLRKVTKVSN